MSFKDCITTAHTTGTISEEKMAEAHRAYDDALLRAADDGLEGGAAHDFATMEAVKQLEKRTADKRWQRINQMRRTHELHEMFKNSTKFQRDVDKLMRKVLASKNTELGRAQARFVKNLEKYRPRAAGFWHPTGGLRDMVYAAYGKTVKSEEARELATEAMDAIEYLRKRANAFGASIAENPNRRLPQMHDRLKIKNAGRAKWVSDHMQDGVLDWDVMEYDGKYIPKDMRERILSTVWDTIVTEGDSKLKPGQRHNFGTLATELSRERFLYYKTPEAWLQMQDQYGRGNVFQQFVGQMESMAAHIATMKHLGPNPDAGLGFVKNTIHSRAAALEIAKGGGAGRSYKSVGDEAVASLQDQYNILARRVLNGEENWLAMSPATVRNLFGTAATSASTLSAVPGDLGMMSHIALVNRMPAIKLMGQYLKLFTPGTREAKRVAIRSGLIAESATSFAAGYQRYFGPMAGNAVARRVSDVTFRMNLLTPHTQAAKWAWGMETMGTFADMRGKSFENLPIAAMLTRYGITAEDWEVFRQTPVFDPDGAHLLRPNDLFDRATTAKERRIADKFQDMILDTTSIAVPTADLRAMSSIGHGSNPGTLNGEILRTVGMLKSYPVMTYTLHLRDMLERSSTRGRLAYLGSFALTTILAGAFITQLKSLAAGRDPEDMTAPTFWTKSLVSGGTLGLFGDAAYSGVSAMFGGPATDGIDDIRKLVTEAGQLFAGDEKANPAGEALELLRKNVPVQNIWQVRLLMQRAVWDEALRYADPQAYRRKQQFERRRVKENGNRSFWPQGSGMPERLPDLGSALGQ